MHLLINKMGLRQEDGDWEADTVRYEVVDDSSQPKNILGFFTTPAEAISFALTELQKERDKLAVEIRAIDAQISYLNSNPTPHCK